MTMAPVQVECRTGGCRRNGSAWGDGGLLGAVSERLNFDLTT